METPEEKLIRLEAENESLKADNAALKVKLDELEASSTEEIGNLSSELSKYQTIANELEPTITVENAVYKVLGKKFTWKLVEYTVAELLKNKNLQKELVKAGAGFLVRK